MSNSNRQPAQMRDVPDSEEDVGHSTSVEFLAAAKTPAKRSHAPISKFKNVVEKGKKKLIKILEEKARSVTRRDYELKDALIKVILGAQRDQTELDERGVKQHSISRPTASAIHQSAKSKIASSRELLGHYERASQQVASGRGVPMMESEWEKDSQTLQGILNKQVQKIKLEVHKFLNEDSKTSKEQVEGDLSELDTDLWNRFAMSEAEEENIEASNGKSGETWAKAAKNAQRGVRRAVKHLPKDGK
ncbi:MAG: hypothetical protein ALECFALPRED_002752 [Alectoria fallacina]|uniref:Uncharacterized protein n=1 Tax=Alectoria fallacina TaxID=1903189 RepID=A0A8H3EKG6_9LECA|nr:MAG: hypothetical protein ALECFALPRED_002752 [Alectoria fallacina]